MNLGRYKIIEELGRGSFGTVYKAEDQTLDRVVAIKVLHSQLTVDPGFIGRFNQEAKLAVRLDHPNLVPIYDLGQIDGRFFIAMGLMSGGSLKDRLNKEGAFDADKARDVFSQILQGMQVIHDNNIIHRDLKPGNILFDQYGIARISDLGFAKAIHSDASLSLSMSGGMIGTPAYMAPEIWEGKPASPASDIYSLGCILYEILTGEVLFDGESAAEVMTKHVIHGPKLETRALPLFWKNILEKCLAPKAQDRYASIQQIFDDLKEEVNKDVQENLVEDFQEETVSQDKSENVEFLQEDPAVEMEKTEPDLDSLEAQPTADEEELLTPSDSKLQPGDEPILEPDMIEVDEQEDLSAFVNVSQRLEEENKLVGSNKPWLIPLLIGLGLVTIVLILVLTNRPKQAVYVYPEPTEVYDEPTRELTAMPTATTQVKETEEKLVTPTVPDLPISAMSVSEAMFDNKLLKLYSVNPNEPNTRSLENVHIYIQCIGCADSQSTDYLLTDNSHAYDSLIWSPNGSLVAAVRDDIELVIIDPVQKTEEVIATGEMSNREISWSPDGREIAYRDLGSVMVVDITNGTIRTVVDGSKIQNEYNGYPDVNGITWSETGEYLGFWTRMSMDGNDERGWTIWTVKRDGTSLKKYAPPSGYGYMNLAWAHDEPAFVFYRFTMDSNGQRGPYELMTGNIETGEVTKRKDFYTTRLECYYPQIYDFDADTLAYCYTWDRD